MCLRVFLLMLVRHMDPFGEISEWHIHMLFSDMYEAHPEPRAAGSITRTPLFILVLWEYFAHS